MPRRLKTKCLGVPEMKVGDRVTITRRYPGYNIYEGRCLRVTSIADTRVTFHDERMRPTVMYDLRTGPVRGYHALVEI